MESRGAAARTVSLALNTDGEAERLKTSAPRREQTGGLRLRLETPLCLQP